MSAPPSFEIVIVPPPAPYLKAYNLSLSSTLQHASIPQPILDAFSIREAVFVREQNLVALEHHLNAEDGRSFHFVAYPSASTAKPDGPPKPIGTLRILPPPNTRHPEPGSVIYSPPPGKVEPPSAEELFGRIMEEEVRVRDEEWGGKEPTDFWDGKEGFLHLGRASVLQEWRGKGVADAMLREAVRWAQEDYRKIEKEKGEKEEKRWKGLLLAYARKEARRMWERNGFVEDEKLGRWLEIQVELFGVWRRVNPEGEERKTDRHTDLN